MTKWRIRALDSHIASRADGGNIQVRRRKFWQGSRRHESARILILGRGRIM